MADTDSNSQYDEFIIDSSKLQLVLEIQNKIEQMFSVSVYVDESTDVKCEKSWLKLEGQNCDRKNAREYILAVCHPESKQKLQIKEANSDLFDKEVLEDIEMQTCALITLQDNTIEICGTELAVILAMTTLESKGAVGIEDMEADGETDGKTDVSQKPPAKNRWSRKMDSQLEKLLCDPKNRSESMSINDFSKTSPSIKMTILKCMQEMDDISDSDLFPSCRDDAGTVPSYRLPIYIDDESEEEKVEKDSLDGKSVKQLTEKLTTAQISPTSSPRPAAKQKVSGFPEEEYFRSFGKSVGYSEADVEVGLQLCDEKTTPADFLGILNQVQENKKVGKDTTEKAKADVPQKNNFPPPPDVPSPSSTPVNGRRSLPQEYKKKLVKDFSEETADLSVEELKRRNEERQKVLKSAFEQGLSNVSDPKSPQKKKRKKKKRKKGSGPVKFIGEGSKENPAIVSGSDDDEEQTKVMTIWNENPDEDSDSDDCMIVDETFPTTAPSKNTNSNQPKAEVQKQPQKPSGIDQPSNSASSSDAFQSTDSNQSTGEPWTVVQNQKAGQQRSRFDQPPPPLFPTNPGDFQFNRGTSNNRGPSRWDVPPPNLGQNNFYHVNQIPPPGVVTAPVLGAGGHPINQQKNLRYIVIDGSNVAMCHGCHKVFSCRGIKIVIDYFLQRGHTQVTAFVPEWRRYRETSDIKQQQLLNEMQEEGHVVFTPSRRINNRLIASYDDRFILELAEREDGIIVSNDQYRDLMQEKYSWRKIIEDRLLLFSFVGDNFMPPFDPLGRNGPNLDEFLSKPQGRKRHTVPYYQERNPQINAWNAGKRQRENFNPRPVGQPYPGAPPTRAWVRPQHAQQRQNNQMQQGGQGRGGGGRGGAVNPQSPQKPAGPLRNKAKTKEIEDQLKAIFPENGGKISEILQNHPYETDVEKLTNYLMNAVFSS
ncbi:NEDD4-binding protein 1-like [Saccostrea echinata]|uniref:NEDD4-binding protein 1-like n=1 Tax=Saccostrea echinata TaxID=191078 RepID=UPI002A8193A8|nr:NEDD4-binding protein 1-like [Saccostrea echinata]